MRKSRLPVGLAVTALLGTLLAVGWPAVQAQGAGPVLNPVQVVGPNVTFTWSPMAGASSYGLQAGVAPGAYLVGLNVGNTTTFSTMAPMPAVYFARIVALNAAGSPIGASQEVAFHVTSMFVPPAKPANLTTHLNGSTAVITWEAGTGGGALAGYLLQAGTASGASDIGQFPFPASTTSLQVPVGAGTYYLRVLGVNQGGVGAASDEATLNMPAGGGCTAPPTRSINQTIFGHRVRLSWAPVPGALGYVLNVTGTHALSAFVPPHTPFLQENAAPLGVYQASLTTVFACGQSSVGPQTTITVDGAPPPGPRAPNPPPGQLIPDHTIGWGAGVIEHLARERPDLLHASCREHGGNNRFMFEAVRRLRARDNRFGLNWKRGNRGDLSQDIVTYNASSGVDEGARSPNIYIFDIIGGHCGSNPSAAWINQTRATAEAGTIGIWTLLPYLDAGYPLGGDLMPQ